MNKLIKKVLVGITAATMMLGSVCTAYAATDSATVAPAPEQQTNAKTDNGTKVSTSTEGNARIKGLPTSVASKKSVTVPSKITVDGVSYTVATLGKGALANATKATKITLPSTITAIGNYSFKGATSVKTVVVTSTKAVKVSSKAFKGVNTKKMTIKVTKMSTKQFKAFKAQLKKAGFKGTVKLVK